jgi:hypothetical protein
MANAFRSAFIIAQSQSQWEAEAKAIILLTRIYLPLAQITLELKAVFQRVMSTLLTKR